MGRESKIGKYGERRRRREEILEREMREKLGERNGERREERDINGKTE